jgi:hypothetical protein
LGQGSTLFPVVQARLELPSGKLLPLDMLPDSGATGTVLPRKYAVPLGFDLRSCEKVKVDTGNGLAHHYKAPAPVRALIADRELDLYPCFGNIGVPVLGREDFFREFYLEIDERRRAVLITPHEP